MSSDVNYRQQWAEGEIEAGTLLDAIDALQYANLRLSQDRGVAKYERDAALAQLSSLEAENARLERLISHWQSLAVANRKVADDAITQLAAIQGGMGEVVEVVAYLIEYQYGSTGGTMAGLSKCSLEGFCRDRDLEPSEVQLASDPLMTVAQHQRITAAMAAENSELRLQCGGMQMDTDELRAALTKTVASLDQLLPYLGKIPADVGLLNDALVAARLLLEQNTNKEVTPDGK